MKKLLSICVSIMLVLCASGCSDSECDCGCGCDKCSCDKGQQSCEKCGCFKPVTPPTPETPETPQTPEETVEYISATGTYVLNCTQSLLEVATPEVTITDNLGNETVILLTDQWTDERVLDPSEYTDEDVYPGDCIFKIWKYNVEFPQIEAPMQSKVTVKYIPNEELPETIGDYLSSFLRLESVDYKYKGKKHNYNIGFYIDVSASLTITVEVGQTAEEAIKNTIIDLDPLEAWFAIDKDGNLTTSNDKKAEDK